MTTAPQTDSDLLVTVKSREIQRGLLAEMAGDRTATRRHFLAAAHLELVLEEDYDRVGEGRLALRSRLSAASCLWRAGRVEEARGLFAELEAAVPGMADDVRRTRADLEGWSQGAG